MEKEKKKSSKIGDLHIKQYNALFKNNIIDNLVFNIENLNYKKFVVSFEKIEIHKAYDTEKVMDNLLFPYEFRESCSTYAGNMFVKVKLMYENQVLFNEFKHSGKFPIMVRSDMCHLKDTPEKDFYKYKEDYNENGGYFIVGGYDKLVRFHIAYKRNWWFASFSKSKDSLYSGFSCFIRAVGNDEIGQKYTLIYTADGNVLFKCYFYKKAYLIPVVFVLKALKNVTDEEIYKKLGKNQKALHFLERTVESMTKENVNTRNKAQAYLGGRFKFIFKTETNIESGRIFCEKILQHLPGFEDKFESILYGIRKLFYLVDGHINADNIDLPSNHELYTEAQLIPLCIKERIEEIKKIFKIKLQKIIQKELNKKDHVEEQVSEDTTNISSTMMSKTNNTQTLLENTTVLDDLIKNGDVLAKVKSAFEKLDFNIGVKIERFLSSGNLTTMTCSDMLQTSGFTIIAERINYWRFASHFESVSRGSFFSTLKITTIRKLRPEGFGFFCPVNTPDGSPCGLLTHLTKNCELIEEPGCFDPNVLYELGCLYLTEENDYSPILKNGNKNQNPKAQHKTVQVFYNGKLMGFVENAHEFVGNLRFFRNKNMHKIEIVHEFGENVDEVIAVVDELGAFVRKVINKKTGTIEYVGIKEQVFLGIDLQTNKEENIYAEINTENMFSTLANCISFGDHNPSPRNMYQCQMAKQAMGLPAYNQFSRTDNKAYTINYLQEPFIRTKGYEKVEKWPIGFNCIVAVLSYTAYDMEDAVILNKASVDKGMFSGYVIKNEKVENVEKIIYTAPINVPLKEGDIYCIYKEEGIIKKLLYKDKENAILDRVRIYDMNAKTNNLKLGMVLTWRILRIPVIGDKFCSRHGQKGVCSFLWSQIDMPFTEEGLQPDIIINPHAFPSRMTIGMLIESMCGKVAAKSGEFADATMFSMDVANENNKFNVTEKLKECGFNYHGNEPMYSGITGTEFKTDIFIGVVYYQRLRHMVSDKFQVRTSGAIVSTTHQPVKGRKNKGGIRFGEMEKDALIGHGVSKLIRDRLMNCSDRTEFKLCVKCKSILFTFGEECKCGSKTIKKVYMPYVFKYLCVELAAMGLKVEYQ
ncbi:acr-2 [Ecytonucleospora hepatopenaei]|uniref:DNA-directed RNA polymerase subunit beta n=1 Tax=Ecytonucleospora hepatopenaei TaxID=646526 RepID=A0A1W0E6Y7_9MICR|nr:acr-2 [Ecytonucleospora hepatopenaei]